MNRMKAWLSIFVGAIYILNPGWGLFELIPDNIPLFGNLDEGAAVLLLVWGVKTLRNHSKKNEKE